MKRLILLALVMLLAGCALQESAPETTQTMPDPLADFSYSIIPHERQASGFFLRQKLLEQAVEYEICYRYPNGEEEVVVNQGTGDSPFEILNGRIYYIDGGLCSVDFMGEDRQTLVCGYELQRLLGQKDGMLVCRAQKLVDSVKDPAGADGPHWVEVQLLISPDFTQVLENNME